jgi:hypothetical protein
VNSGALVPASSWGMVFLTTVREWGHNSAFAHTVSSSPLTVDHLAARRPGGLPAMVPQWQPDVVTIRGQRTLCP